MDLVNQKILRTKYKLIRGIRAQIDCTVLEQIAILNSEAKQDEITALISSQTTDGCFDGVLFSVKFQADRSIILTSLGFWGPSGETAEMYDVSIIISEYQNGYPTNDRDELHLSRLKTRVEAEAKKIFEIKLEDKVLVKANKRYRIQFQLDGPRTCICASVSSSYKCKDSNVNFDFESSSRQLPEINYSLD